MFDEHIKAITSKVSKTIGNLIIAYHALLLLQFINHS